MTSERVEHVAFLCDGDDSAGAGHVSRCLPLANAFEARGVATTFCGSFSGLAGWLLNRAGVRVVPAVPRAADAVVCDSYRIDQDSLHHLAQRHFLATIGEAARCPGRGLVVDYHFDAVPAPDVIAGPHYALIDPGFKRARRDRTGKIRSVLLSFGASTLGLELKEELEPAIRHAMPEADLVSPSYDRPTTILDVIDEIDVAVTGAGVTAYELACAGVPAVLVEMVENQRRVADGVRRAGIALVVPAADPAALATALEDLADRDLRRRLQKAGPSVVDGEGASRAAAELLRRWYLYAADA